MQFRPCDLDRVAGRSLNGQPRQVSQLACVTTTYWLEDALGALRIFRRRPRYNGGWPLCLDAPGRSGRAEALRRALDRSAHACSQDSQCPRTLSAPLLLDRVPLERRSREGSAVINLDSQRRTRRKLKLRLSLLSAAASICFRRHLMVSMLASVWLDYTRARASSQPLFRWNLSSAWSGYPQFVSSFCAILPLLFGFLLLWAKTCTRPNRTRVLCVFGEDVLAVFSVWA